MMFSNPTHASVIVALVISALAVAVWAALFARTIALRKRDRRPTEFAMPIVGLIASLGTLFSAIGFAAQFGMIDYFVSADVMSLISSMGRGALLMGGILAFMYYRPPKEGK